MIEEITDEEKYLLTQEAIALKGKPFVARLSRRISALINLTSSMNCFSVDNKWSIQIDSTEHILSIDSNECDRLMKTDVQKHLSAFIQTGGVVLKIQTILLNEEVKDE